MEPNITLHWFAHPQWFSDLGEFTKEENIALFEDWTKFAFTNYGEHLAGNQLLAATGAVTQINTSQSCSALLMQQRKASCFAVVQHVASSSHMLILHILCCVGKYAKLWATFNEPEVACLCGHIMGNHPPGKRMQFKGAGQKLCNMLRAHAAAYKVIKSLPGDLRPLGLCL